MDIVGGVTLGIALVGAVLGILNTWRNLDRDRPKLRVRPFHVIPVGGYGEMHSDINFGIEVVNLSSFPLTVSEVGFRHKGLTSRSAAIQPLTLDGKPMPRRL